MRKSIKPLQWPPKDSDEVPKVIILFVAALQNPAFQAVDDTQHLKQPFCSFKHFLSKLCWDTNQNFKTYVSKTMYFCL